MYPVQLLCQAAGVSRSGYYKWLMRQTSPSKKQIDDQALMEKILQCHEIHNGIYGYLRVKTWLFQYHQLIVNHKRVYRLMKRMGIQARIRRKKQKYFGRKEAWVISKNHLNREFQATKPNEKWVTDVTYLVFNQKKLYLSVILDLFNNEVIAYQISKRNDLKLVTDTVKMAVKKRGGNGTLLHSDQGYQYTSRQYNQLLQRFNIKASMSRKGNCLDNACAESFFSHFKTECFHLHQFYYESEVKHAVRKYIKFYNTDRFQKRLNNLSPLAYRAKVA
jgi:putative transposase